MYVRVVRMITNKYKLFYIYDQIRNPITQFWSLSVGGQIFFFLSNTYFKFYVDSENVKKNFKKVFVLSPS